MRLVVRSTVVALLSLLAAVLLALSTTWTSVVLAATALIMGGTGHPLSIPQDSSQFIKDYVNGANSNYIAANPSCGTGCTLVAVYTPEQFRFDTGIFDMTFDKSVAIGRQNLDNCLRSMCIATTGPNYDTTANQPVTDPSGYVIYGYSQSATVATVEKRYLKDHPISQPVSFDLVANPNRPNGGILERFNGLYIPIVGVTFNGATPTDTNMLTADTARQYDGWTDFPTNPLNLLADLNAGLGIYYLHGNYYGVGTPEPQGQYGDTTYYLIATPVLPLLMPLEKVPVIGNALAVTLDPFFRVLVEAGYDRTINPGQPTTAKLLYFPNPIKTAVNLVVAVPTGLDNGISTVTGNRPLGTDIPGPYGVGGPPVDTGCGTSSCGPVTPSLTMSSPATTSFAADAQDETPSPPPDPKPKDDEQTAPDTSKSKILPFNIKPTDTPSSTQGTNTPKSPADSKPPAPKFPVLNKVVTTIAGAFNNSSKTSKTKPPADGDESPGGNTTSTTSTSTGEGSK